MFRILVFPVVICEVVPEAAEGEVKGEVLGGESGPTGGVLLLRGFFRRSLCILRGKFLSGNIRFRRRHLATTYNSNKWPSQTIPILGRNRHRARTVATRRTMPFGSTSTTPNVTLFRVASNFRLYQPTTNQGFIFRLPRRLVGFLILGNLFGSHRGNSSILPAGFNPLSLVQAGPRRGYEVPSLHSKFKKVLYSLPATCDDAEKYYMYCWHYYGFSLRGF